MGKMARYTASTCYGYTSNQAQMLEHAKAIALAKHQEIDMVNTTKKMSLDNRIEQIDWAISAFIRTLVGSSYS